MPYAGVLYRDGDIYVHILYGSYPPLDEEEVFHRTVRVLKTSEVQERDGYDFVSFPAHVREIHHGRIVYTSEVLPTIDGWIVKRYARCGVFRSQAHLPIIGPFEKLENAIAAVESWMRSLE